MVQLIAFAKGLSASYVLHRSKQEIEKQIVTERGKEERGQTRALTRVALRCCLLGPLENR